LVAQGLTESGVNVTMERYPCVAYTVEVVFSLSEPKASEKPGAGTFALFWQLAGS
jgi:hypothetical protein